MFMFLNVTNIKIILMFLLVSLPIAVIIMLRLVRPLKLRLRYKIFWSTLILLVVWFAALALPLTLRTSWYPEIYKSWHLEQLLPWLYYAITFLCVLFLIIAAVDIVLGIVKLTQWIRSFGNKKGNFENKIENAENGKFEKQDINKLEELDGKKLEKPEVEIIERLDGEKIEKTDIGVIENSDGKKLELDGEKLENTDIEVIEKSDGEKLEKTDIERLEDTKEAKTESEAIEKIEDGSHPILPKHEDAPISRREFLRIVRSAGIAGGALTLTPVAIYYARNRRVVKQIDISLPSIPAGLDGFRIVHLSDIHVGNTIGRDDIAGIVAETNALDPDLIAITGDMADGFPDLIGDWLEPMRNFKSRYGTFFVTGNHDHMWNAAGWCEKIAELGIHVLDNAHEIIDVNGTQFAVAGALDYRGDRRNRKWKSDPAKALSDIPHNLFRLMLVHQPSSVDTCFKFGANLVLLGHTHGGQFWPLSYLINAMHKYARGLYMVGDKAAFVSCGTGYWGPPLRFGVPPEIDVITLRSPVVLNG